MKYKVVSLNISEKKGTIKKPVVEVEINERGIINDAHAGDWHRQISLLAKENIDTFIENSNRETGHGEFAENITTKGIDLSSVSVLDRFKINDVELEITQIGKKCHGAGCAIYDEVGECIMPKEGIFSRVITGGTIKNGDEIEFIPKSLKFHVFTLSDRVIKGEYEDLSGPKIVEHLQDFFKDKRWHTEIESDVLSDDKMQLKMKLESAINEGVDIIITTGGTGVGPRDITPDVVASVSDKVIPGIMEHIRLKYAANNPNALLSRGIVGLSGRTLIYTLPGNVTAINEYMEEILKTMEHLITMIYGVGH